MIIVYGLINKQECNYILNSVIVDNTFLRIDTSLNSE